MAANLLQAGFDLMVHDVREAPVQELAVADDAQVESVVLGKNGVIEGVAPGAVVIIRRRCGNGLVMGQCGDRPRGRAQVFRRPASSEMEGKDRLSRSEEPRPRRFDLVLPMGQERRGLSEEAGRAGAVSDDGLPPDYRRPCQGAGGDLDRPHPTPVRHLYQGGTAGEGAAHSEREAADQQRLRDDGDTQKCPASQCDHGLSQLVPGPGGTESFQ